MTATTALCPAYLRTSSGGRQAVEFPEGAPCSHQVAGVFHRVRARQAVRWMGILGGQKVSSGWPFRPRQAPRGLKGQEGALSISVPLLAPAAPSALCRGPALWQDAVSAGGPLLAILGFAILPFIWSLPEALITAELATAFPENR